MFILKSTNPSAHTGVQQLHFPTGFTGTEEGYQYFQSRAQVLEVGVERQIEVLSSGVAKPSRPVHLKLQTHMKLFVVNVTRALLSSATLSCWSQLNLRRAIWQF